MFDLFRRKDTTLRYALGILLGLVAFSMVITLIPGFGGGGFGMGPGDNVVAKVCGEAVTEKEIRQRIQSLLNQGKLPPESAAIFIPQLIDQIVAVKGVACFADETGLKASEKDVALAIQKNIPQLWQDGKFVGEKVYGAFLAQSGVTIQQYEDSVRRDLETQRLRSVVLMSAAATPREVEEAFHDAEDKIKLEYLVVDPQEVGKGIKIPDAEVQASFEKRKAEFTVPEAKIVNLFLITMGNVQGTVQVTEEDLKRAYSDNIESFRLPERAHVRHILFKTQGKPESEDAKMKAKAEETLKQIKAGANFAELAKKLSEDPGSGQNGGDLGNVVRGATVKNFDEYSFTGPLKTLSAPIKTEFGYHLIEVLERFPAGQQTFAEVRPALEAEVRRAKSTDLTAKIADQLRTALTKNPAEGLAMAQKLNITPLRFEYKAPDAALPGGVGVKPEIYQSLSGSRKGEVLAPITIGTDKSLLVQLDSVIPAHPAKFEDVKNVVLSQLLVSAGQKKVEEIRKQLTDQIKAGNNDIAKLAKEVNSPVKTTQEFTRGGFADGIGPASAVLDSFGKKVGEIQGPFTVDGKWFVAKVVDRKDADMSLLPARRAEFVNRVKTNKAGERSDIFEDTIVRQMIKEGQIQINENIKKRIAASYTGQ